MNNIERVRNLAGIALIAVGIPGCDVFSGKGGNPTTVPARTPIATGYNPEATSAGTAIITATVPVTATKIESTVITKTMELPKPAAWDHAPIISLVKAVNVPSFPKTREEAAKTFGVDGSTKDPKRWELTPEGGWHLSEAQIGDDTKDALNVNPGNWTMEGYFDTEPGYNPFAMAVSGINSNIPVQGATFWNEKGKDQDLVDKLQREMAIPMWKDKNGKVTAHPATKIVPNQVVSNEVQKQEATPVVTPVVAKKENTATSVPSQVQKQEATPVASAEYPQTAEKAASLFGGKPGEWKLNPQGVWNFNSKEETTMTLDGVTADGYNKDGPVVATGSNGKVSVKLLGGTFYDLKPEQVQALIDAVRANNPGKQIQVVGVK